ncbi:MAG: GYF domain-containing protein [Pirellulales bacterium]
MSDSYYIRIRGRVQGPFDDEKLQGLVKRGQFSRMHEISPDGIQWSPASTHPHLFSGSTSRKTAEQAVPVQQATATPSARVAAPPADWYFTVNGERQGPVSWEVLQSYASTRRFTSHDLVWNGTMPDWLPAGQIEGLFPRIHAGDRISAVDRVAASQSTSDVIGPAVRTLEDSLGTLMFLAVWCDVMGVLFAISCLATLVAPDEISGVAPGSATASALLFVLPMAAVLITGGILLHRFRSRIVEMLRYQDIMHLDKALRALNSFWWFAGLVMAIVTLMFVGLIFLAFSATSMASSTL